MMRGRRAAEQEEKVHAAVITAAEAAAKELQMSEVRMYGVCTYDVGLMGLCCVRVYI